MKLNLAKNIADFNKHEDWKSKLASLYRLSERTSSFFFFLFPVENKRNLSNLPGGGGLPYQSDGDARLLA